MNHRPEFAIKERARLGNLPTLEIAERLNMPYGTLAAQLNGFSPLSNENRVKIMAMIEAAEARQKQAAAA